MGVDELGISTQSGIVIRNRFLLLVQSKIAVAAVVIVLRIIRIDSDRFGEILNCRFITARVKMDAAAVRVTSRVVLIEPPVGVAAIVVSLGVLRVETDSLAIVLDRLLILLKVVVCIAAVEISFSESRLGFDDFVVFLNRFFYFAGFMQIEGRLEGLVHLPGPHRRSDKEKESAQQTGTACSRELFCS